MLYWSVIFLLIAMLAAFFGFTGVYVAAAGIAKILFFIFLVLFVVSLLSGGMWRRPMVENLPNRSGVNQPDSGLLARAILRFRPGAISSRCYPQWA